MARQPVLVAAVAIALAFLAPAAVAASASASVNSAAPAAPKAVCGTSSTTTSAVGARFVARPNEFPGVTSPFCLTARGAGWTLQESLPRGKNVQAYPYSGYGCAYRLCSPGSLLPRRVSSLPGLLSASWTWRGGTAGYWNASFDIWLDKADQDTRQDNGAEVMIWLRTPPGYPRGQLIDVGGRRFWFMHWRTGHESCDVFGRCAFYRWNYVQFRFPRTHHRVSMLRLMPLLNYAARRGLVKTSWFVTSVHAGFELWGGGKGLATSWFWAGRP